MTLGSKNLRDLTAKMFLKVGSIKVKRYENAYLPKNVYRAIVGQRYHLDNQGHSPDSL
jgi:hypothetical protein